jgi:hypothetical protein
MDHRWIINYRDFLQDSKSAARDNLQRKREYLTQYNTHIAPRLKTPEANFQVWANLLAAIHFPGPDDSPTAQHSDISLNIATVDNGNYDTTYRLIDTHISTAVGGCVFHYLEPVNDANSRAILLFRGTSRNPATYRARDGRLNTEPVGAWTDGNLLSVSSWSFSSIKTEVSRWMEQQASRGRTITFVGAGLGGALAMRALKHHAKSQQSGWRDSELYIFNSPGLRGRSARSLSVFFAGKHEQLHAYWHVDDVVPVTGHYPKLLGTEYSRFSAGNPTMAYLGPWEVHDLLFVSLPEGWGETCAYETRSVGSEPNASPFSRKLVGFFKRAPYGLLGTVLVSPFKGIGSRGSLREGNAREWCRHPTH